MNRELLPQTAPAISMRNYILERRLSVGRHHHSVLRAFTDYEGVKALEAYNQELQAFQIKMGNVALRRRILQEEDRYPEEFDELYGDER